MNHRSLRSLPRLASVLTLAGTSLVACGGSPSGTQGATESTTSQGLTAATSTLTGIDGACVDVIGGNTANRAYVGIWSCNGNPWQQWSQNGDAIVGWDGKCLDVRDGATDDGTVVQMFDCNGTGAQVWQARGGELVNPQSGKCLDATGNTSADGTALELWDCWDGPNQQWSFTSATGGGSGGGTTGNTGTTPAPSPTPTGPANAQRAHDFVDHLGVNQHLGWDGTSYNNAPLEITELAYLGVSHVRDCPNTWDDFASVARAGVRFDCPLGTTNDEISTALPQYIADWESMESQVAGSMESIEGPNELNGQIVYWNGQPSSDPSVAVAIQQALYPAVKNDAALAGVKVLNNSINESVGDYEGYIGAEGDLSAFMDQGNWHTYDWNAPPGAAFTAAFSDAAKPAPGKSIVFTEFGYSAPNWVDEASAGRWTVDGWADTFADGAARLYIYELMDGASGDSDDENNFGLFHTDGSPKAGATTIHDVTTLLADADASAATFAPGYLDYQVSGLGSTGRALLLQKASGVFDLLLWAEDTSGGTTTATVTFGAPVSSATQYDPMQGTSQTSSSTATSSVQVSLTDHLVIVEITP